MSGHEIFLLVIAGIAILLDSARKSGGKKRASKGRGQRPSVPALPTVSESPVFGEETESGLPVFVEPEREPDLPAEDEALPQIYEPVMSGTFEVPETPLVMEEGAPAVQEVAATPAEKTDSAVRKAIDPKKLVIYSEIMSPKFKEF
ncbi:MAG: hypothetical protein ACI3Y9_03860 [Candidatus Cryptobacteroides sp.]